MDVFLLALGLITLVLMILLTIFPSVLGFRYFIQTRSADYLFIVGMYMSFTLGLILLYISYITLEFIYYKLAGIITVGILFFLFLNSIRLRWEKNPFLLTIITFTWMILLIPIFLLSFNQVIYTYMSMGLDLLRVWVFSIMFYAYLTVTPIQSSSQRIIRIRKIFFIIAITQILTGLFLLIFKLSLVGVAIDYFFLPSIEPSVIDYLTNLYSPMVVIEALENITTVILTTFLVIRYPEAYFISRAQILRAMNLYQTVSARTFTIKNRNLNRYLESIPPEIFSEL